MAHGNVLRHELLGPAVEHTSMGSGPRSVCMLLTARKEVAHESVSMHCGYALSVELNAPVRPRSVSNAHKHTALLVTFLSSVQ